MKKVKVTLEEWNELRKLHRQARATPVMLVGGCDLSAAAWDAVRRYHEKLAKKYGVDPKTTAFAPPETKKKED